MINHYLRSHFKVSSWLAGKTAKGLIRCFATKKQEDTKSDASAVDLTKISPKAFLKWELENNPEFEKAFPHLAEKKPQTTIRKDASEVDFVNSLNKQYRVPEDLEFSDVLSQNFRMYVEGYSSPTGPLRWMSSEEKERVHVIIDKKMEELEVTGLSREEILFPERKMKGIPLSRDPFFQYLKKNRLARELLLKQGESLTVEKVIDLALRQDIGPDPSYSRVKKSYIYRNQLTSRDVMSLETNQPIEKELFQPASYYAPEHANKHSILENLKDEKMIYHYLPIRRGKLRKKTMKYLNWYDIHWRNTELLCKFINEAGKIKNRFQSRLPTGQQRKVAKAIKHARNLLLLPHVGNVKPTHRRSLKTLAEDIEEHQKKLISLETGHIYVKENEEGWQRGRRERKPPTEEQLDPSKVPESYSEEEFSKLKDLEFEYLPPMPDEQQVSLLKANLHAKHLKKEQLQKQGVNVEELEKQELASHFSEFDEAFPKMLKQKKEAKENVKPEETSPEFQKFAEKVKNCDFDKFVDLYMAELAGDAKAVNEISAKKKEAGKRAATTAGSADFDSLVKEIAALKKEILSDMPFQGNLAETELEVINKYKSQ